MFLRASSFALMSLMFLLVGCAHYEYDIVSPAEMRQHVGTESEVRLQRAPLEYRLDTIEDHLVVRIYNLSNDMIQLVAERSSVVDPAGQSHPLRGQAIPPNAFMKLILPPTAHYEPVPGQGVRVGGSAGYGYGRPWHEGYDQNIWDEPQYVAVYEPQAWKWEGETHVRLVLTFQAGDGKQFMQEWTFDRKKM
jgi:hypothetical protein